MPDAPPTTNAPEVRKVQALEAADLARLPGVRHAFFTRRGGASAGLYASLNAGVGSRDDPAAVAENRARMAARLGLSPTQLLTLWQVHSNEAVTVDAPFPGERPRADGLATAVPGLAVAVLTADCGPVLFADAANRVVAAAHAGWRGATSGIIEATLEAMERLGARRGNVVAVLGPTITQGAYEVDAAMAAAIIADDGQAARVFAPGAAANKRRFDLPGLILARLERAGVARAAFVGRCTYAAEDAFFSYRRATHRAEPDYGRQLSAIALV